MISNSKIKFFGRFYAEINGVIFQKKKDKSEEFLLAYLALHKGEAVERRKIAEALWPNSNGNSLDNLRRTLTALRAGLGPARDIVVNVGKTHIRLDISSTEVDFIEFDKTIRHIERCSSEAENTFYAQVLLEGWDDKEWVINERAKLKRTCEKIYIILYKRAIDRQNYQKAKDLLKELDALGTLYKGVQHSPDESLWRSLIEKCVEAREYALAWQIYADLEATLKRIDATPSPMSKDLLLCIRQQQHFSRSREALETRLPIPRTRFFGRTQELDCLEHKILEQERLITVIGMGGTGKTRLALELARRLSSYFMNRIWFVPLANLHTTEQIAPAILKALELCPAARENPTEQIAAYFNRNEAPALLILDNFEHLPPECAVLLSMLLVRVPQITCLLTSRSRTGLPEERLLILKPLPLPEPKGKIALSTIPSLALFIDRAQKVLPDFRMTDDNRNTLIALCHRLEGLPLALEMAAARLSAKTLTQMLTEVEQQINLLEHQQKIKNGRHQSLQAVLQWSYNLLSPELQQFFKRLSVFAGSYALNSARSICQNESALDGLDRLYQCSLLILEEADGERRWRMLESVCQFVQEQLGTEDKDKYQRRHFCYFWKFAKRAEYKLLDAQQTLWFSKLETEHDNLRAALAWAQEAFSPGVLRLGGSLWRFWQTRGLYTEGRNYLEKALEQPGGTKFFRRKALTAAGNLAWPQGDYEAMLKFNLQSLALADKPRDRGVSLNNLGLASWEQHDYEIANDYFMQSLAIDHECQDTFGMTITLENLGCLRIDQGQYVEAQKHLKECLRLARLQKNKQTIARALNGLGLIAHKKKKYRWACEYFEQSITLKLENEDQRGEAISRHNLGLTKLAEGEHIQARYLFHKALHIRHDSRDKLGIIESLEGVATLAITKCEYIFAVTLLSAASKYRQQIGVKIASCDKQEYDEQVQQVQKRLSTPEFHGAWNEGDEMDIEHASTIALAYLAQV